jgi:chemotaxis protein methyltransferase CheR
LDGIPGRDLKELRIWCAGCASGEEAYTLAIELLEFAQRENLPLSGKIILATDISLSALEAAVQERFPFKKKFHMIFCRNVMIYFDKLTKDRLAEQFSEMLYPGGHLFIGHSESLGRDSSAFEYRQPALYKKRGGVTTWKRLTYVLTLDAEIPETDGVDVSAQ